MKRYTYRIVNGEEELLCEEDFNEQGLVVLCRDYGTDPTTDRISTYNINGQLTEETECCDEEEMSRVQYTFNEAGLMTERNHYIGGELYEKRTVEYTGDDFTRVTVEDEEETERMTCKREGLSDVFTFYKEGRVAEIHIKTGDLKEGKLTTEFFDEKNVRFKKEVEYCDQDLKPLKKEIYNRNDKVEEEYTWEYDPHLPVKETLRFPEAGKSERAYTISWEYDDLGNPLKMEVRDAGGRLLEFHLKNYDEHGRVIEESGLASSKVQPLYAAAPAGRFHYVYSYDKYGKAMMD